MLISRGTQETDRKLRALGPLKRYSSLSATGLSVDQFRINAKDLEQVEHWRKKITHMLESRIRVKTEVRAAEGWRIDPDEAMLGESECFRLHVLQKKAPLKIGINLSAAYNAANLNSLRGGAVIALIDLCKKQGRRFSIEVAYGNGKGSRLEHNECHIRINLEPYSALVGRICLSEQSMELVGRKCVAPLSPDCIWRGHYRFHEYEAEGIHEYDFVLDRIETQDLATEEKRIMDRLIKLGVSK